MSRPVFNLADPIDRLAVAGARILEFAPGLDLDELTDILAALSYPERFEIVAGKITRKAASK